MLFLVVMYSVMVLVNGYGYKMHTYLGKLTDNYLMKYERELYDKVVSMLGGVAISEVSSWADKVKRKVKYSWTKELHFIDIFECSIDRYDKTIVDKYCHNNCIISALQDFANSIKYNTEYDYVLSNNSTLTNVELLKFIIHFVQDFSQPMHLLGYERGGNGFRVNMYMNGRNRTSNLHYIWDSMLPEYFVNNYMYKITNRTFTKPDNYYTILENVLNDNMQIACKIYPESHYIIFDEYFDRSNFMTLFDNYQYVMTTTLKYIFT